PSFALPLISLSNRYCVRLKKGLRIGGLHDVSDLFAITLQDLFYRRSKPLQRCFDRGFASHLKQKAGIIKFTLEQRHHAIAGAGRRINLSWCEYRQQATLTNIFYMKMFNERFVLPVPRPGIIDSFPQMQNIKIQFEGWMINFFQ